MVDVIFTTTSGEEWQIEMDANTLNILATHKPIIDGKNGVSAYQITEFRYDVDNGRFQFFMIELK